MKDFINFIGEAKFIGHNGGLPIEPFEPNAGATVFDGASDYLTASLTSSLGVTKELTTAIWSYRDADTGVSVLHQLYGVDSGGKFETKILNLEHRVVAADTFRLALKTDFVGLTNFTHTLNEWNLSVFSLNTETEVYQHLGFNNTVGVQYELLSPNTAPAQGFEFDFSDSSTNGYGADIPIGNIGVSRQWDGRIAQAGTAFEWIDLSDSAVQEMFITATEYKDFRNIMSWLVHHSGDATTFLPNDAQNKVYNILTDHGGVTSDTGPTPPFNLVNPLDVGNLALWLDASDLDTITDTGGSVDQWDDKSGNDNHATASGSPRPTTGDSTINGLNAITFDGNASNDGFSITEIDESSGLTVVIVTNPDTSSSIRTFMGHSANGGVQIRLDADDNIDLVRHGQAVTLTGTFPVTEGSAQVITAQTSSTGSRSFINGLLQDMTSANPSYTAGISRIGQSGGVQEFDGSIAEIFVYQEVLTQAQLNQIHDYVEWKWGVGMMDIAELPSPTTMAVFGDSITEGVAASVASQRWANQLSVLVSATTLYNNGISGTVLQNSNDSSGNPRANNGRDRYVADLTGANKRDAVFILYGFNDLRYTAAPETMNVENYQNDLNEVVQGLLSAGYTTNDIIIGSPPYASTATYATGSTGFTGSNATIHAQYVAAAAAVAAANNVWYADVYQWMADNGDDSLISGDDIHPTDVGHDVITKAFYYAEKQ